MTPAAALPTQRTADADVIADLLATPPAPPLRREQAQSLADGAAGTALLHIERALTGTGRWDTAHRWLRAAVHHGVLATIDASLYRGAPAVAFTLHTAAAGHTDRYTTARKAVDRAVTALAHRRIDQAQRRIACAELPTMAEFDVICGLTGIGAHLLHHLPDNEALPRILAYLVRLTEPLHHDGDTIPGWWVRHDPHATTTTAFPGGHANFGLAHGITGPLALLALAKRRGITVDNHLDAIERINAWLDTWRQHDDTGTWWPQWITHQERRTGRPAQTGPGRPSWCYGTPGIARTQQLAALATSDLNRQQLAEQALATCLADPRQLARIGDLSLCHGWAGLLATAQRAAVDATTVGLASHLSHIADQLLRHTATLTQLGDGLLEGRAGVALALSTAGAGAPPQSGWDACLLIA